MTTDAKPAALPMRTLPRDAAIFLVVVFVAATLLELLLDDANFTWSLMTWKLVGSLVATAIYAAISGWKRWRAAR